MNVAVNCPCRSTAQRPADATMCSIVEWATTFVLFRISSLHRHVYTIPHCCAQLFSSAFSISLMSALEMRALKVTATHLTLRDCCRNVEWRHTFKTELFGFCEVVRKITIGQEYSEQRSVPLVIRLGARMDYVSKSLHILGAALNYKHTILEQRRIREEVTYRYRRTVCVVYVQCLYALNQRIHICGILLVLARGV